MKKGQPRQRSNAGFPRSKHLTRHLLLAAAAIAPAGQAQVIPLDPVEWARERGISLEQPDPRLLDRWGISLRFGFNVRAEFKNRSGVTTMTDPGPATGVGMNRFYDDGFVRPDETFPANGGLTFFWGYENASQVGPTDIFYHSASAAIDGTTDHSTGGVSVGLESLLGFVILLRLRPAPPSGATAGSS